MAEKKIDRQKKWQRIRKKKKNHAMLTVSVYNARMQNHWYMTISILSSFSSCFFFCIFQQWIFHLAETEILYYRCSFLLLKYHANKHRNAEMFNTILPSAWAIEHTCTQKRKRFINAAIFYGTITKAVKLTISLDWFQVYFCYSFQESIDLGICIGSVNAK